MMVRGVGGILLLLAAIVWSAWRFSSAHDQYAQALNASQATLEQLHRIAALRQALHGVALARQPDADLVDRVQAALARAGLPIAACTGVEPRADRDADASGGMHLQTVQISLQRLTPGELGSWLAAWQQIAPAWQVADLQLSHAQAAFAGTAIAGTGGDLDSNAFDAMVAVEAAYVDSAP
jgi:hypothetical protein